MGRLFLCKACGNKTLISQDACLQCGKSAWRTLSDDEAIYGVEGAKKLHDDQKQLLFNTKARNASTFLKLCLGDNFIKSELIKKSPFLTVQDIGDSVYTITDMKSRIVCASDIGNGNGAVLSVTNYGDSATNNLKEGK